MASSEGLPLIAFDEAGNTGQELLNEEQPVFVLGSVHLSTEVASHLVKACEMPGAKELRFKRMRRTKWGRRLLVDLLNSPHINEHSILVTRYHKRFMVTTKIVDMLVEPMHYRAGMNLYERGANLGLANLWHTVMPVFCGDRLFDRLLASFVAMVRSRSSSTIDAFYDTVDAMKRNCKDDSFLLDLRVLSQTRAFVDEEVHENEVAALDPAIPSFFELATKWTDRLKTEFQIIHDPSTLLQGQRETIESLMATDVPTQTIGFDRRTTAFPIRSSGITFDVSSHDNPQLQIADIIAGAAAFCLAPRESRDEPPDPFATELLGTNFGQVDVGGVWPSTKVTPDELGTDSVGGIDAVTHITEFMSRQRGLRRESE